MTINGHESGEDESDMMVASGEVIAKQLSGAHHYASVSCIGFGHLSHTFAEPYLALGEVWHRELELHHITLGEMGVLCKCTIGSKSTPHETTHVHLTLQHAGNKAGTKRINFTCSS